MDGSTKKITFENFLRALKWCEQATLDEKIRGKSSCNLYTAGIMVVLILSQCFGSLRDMKTL